MEHVLLAVCLVGDARVVVEASENTHLAALETRLYPERATGAPLTGEAVADGDGEGIAFHLQPKLPTMACGRAGSHRGNLTDDFHRPRRSQRHEQTQVQPLDVPRRLHRRPAPEPREPAGRRWHGVARMGIRRA